jgi:hypothetical protein
MRMNRLLPVRQEVRVADLLLIEWPHISEDLALSLIWEVTGYPTFFQISDAEPTSIHVLRHQMREFRENPTNVWAEIEAGLSSLEAALPAAPAAIPHPLEERER